MKDDAELLRRYAESRSEGDFAALVERYLGLVYQAALRRTGGRSDLAQDAAQHVFTTLAREAPKLVSHPALVGWLFTATRHAAGHLLRTERRRRERERDATVSSALEESVPEANWDEIRPQLDEMMDKLPEQDRTAILLRFFHRQPFAEIGRVFGLTEDAARKRVERALERLRGLLAKRGITSTATALGVMLSHQASTAAPVGLAQTIVAAALLPGAAATLPAAGLVHLMNTKFALSVAGAFGFACLLVVPPVGLALFQNHQAAQAEIAVGIARQENARRTIALDRLRGQVGAAAQNVAGLKSELDRARAAASAATSAATPKISPADAKALDDGKEFFARFPQARQTFLEMSRAQVRVGFTGFYRSANLTAAQRDELESRTAELRLATQRVRPGGQLALVSDLPAEQVRQIVGEENFQRYRDFTRAQTADRVTRTVEVVVGLSAPPLLPEQSDALVASIRGNSSAYQSGGALRQETVDWAAVIAQARDFLTPEQWQAAQHPLLSAQVQTARAQAEKEKPKT